MLLLSVFSALLFSQISDRSGRGAENSAVMSFAFLQHNLVM